VHSRLASSLDLVCPSRTPERRLTPMGATVVQKSIGRRDLLLLLLGINGHTATTDGLGGMTRLQKLLFLLEQESCVTPSGEGFNFVAYKAGPYSSKLYDDLEFLENLDLIEKRATAEGTEEEAAEIDFTFESLIEPEAESDDPSGPAPDAYEEYSFSLTPSGISKVRQMLDDRSYAPVVDAVRNIKIRYGQYSLKDLLYYVYSKYPEMTTESEIKEKVLRRNRSY
jgi:hypothetical protein